MPNKKDNNSNASINSNTQQKNSTKIEDDVGNRYIWERMTESNTRDIEKLRNELMNERLNNITIFGIFASLVTFLSVEIQIFRYLTNFWLIIGLTSFLAGILLLFVFCIYSIAKDKLKLRDFFSSPIFFLFLLFLLFSFIIFLLNSKGVNLEFKIKG